MVKKVLLLIACGLSLCGADLLSNGGFEKFRNGQLSGWSYPWKNPLHKIDGTIKAGGKNALQMPPMASGYYALIGYQGDIADFPAELVLQGKVRYENLKVGAQPDGKRFHEPFIGIWTNRANGNNSVTFPAVRLTSGTRDWFSFEFKLTKAQLDQAIQKIPADQRPTTWSLRLNFSPQSGTIWLDDFKLIDPAVKEGLAVVYGGDAGRGEAEAAKDLAAYLGRVMGKSIPVIDPADYVAPRPAVFLGPEAAKLAKEFKSAPNYSPEEWHFQKLGDRFIITGGRPRGVGYGVYEFLEKYAKCHWLDFDTEVVPSNASFAFPAVNERNKPAFTRREIYTESPQSGLFRLRNKESLRTGRREFDSMIGLPNGCHTFSWYSKKWTNPEMFALRAATGKRQMYSQLCMTNPEVHAQILRQLREYIAQDRKGRPEREWPMIYDISQNDGGSGGECYCPGCKKIFDENGKRYSAVNNYFINQIAREIKKTNPEITLRTFAYSYTQEPPIKVGVDDNVQIHSCNSWLFQPLLPGTKAGKILTGWKPFAKNIAIWGYWRPYVGFLYPFTKPRNVMQTELQFCRDNGVQHYFAETETAEKRSFFQFQHWLGLKLMQDPGRNVQELTDIFFTGYYGKAAPVMKKYLDYLEKRQSEVPTSGGGGGGEQWKYLDDAFYKTVNPLLDQAEALVKDNALHSRHVRHERIPVDESVLILWAELEKRIPVMPDRKTLIERFERNSRDIIVNTEGARWRQKQLDVKLKELANEVKLYKALPVALPEQFKGKEIVELHWKDFSPFSDHIARCLAEEPGAVCGMAFRIPNSHIDPKRHHRKAIHYAPMEFGLYDRMNKAASCTNTIPADKIPQDEKYHWYRVGVVEVQPSTIIWVHWSWMIHIYLRKAAVDIIPPKMEVWMSMKLTGPAYVRNSTQPDNVYVERVILVRQK